MAKSKQGENIRRHSPYSLYVCVALQWATWTVGKVGKLCYLWWTHPCRGLGNMGNGAVLGQLGCLCMKCVCGQRAHTHTPGDGTVPLVTQTTDMLVPLS